MTAGRECMAKKILQAALSISLVVLIWWGVTDGRQIFSPLILPSPGSVAKAAWQLVFDPEVRIFSGGIYNGSLLGHALISTGRVMLGFAAGVLVAIPLGVLVARTAVVEPYIDPVLQILRPIPPIAWTPLAILWFGIGLEAI